MAKTNKQLQAEIDKLTIEKNNLVDMLEIAEKWIRWVSKILWLDWIAENTYFNDADIETIEKAIEKLQGKYEKCFEELSMKCGECEWLLKANETIVKAHNELELDKKDLHKRLIEWLQINIEKVEKIWELENKVDEQFKVITKYEKELEEQDKEIEELKKSLRHSGAMRDFLETEDKKNQNEIEELKEKNKKLQSNNIWNSEYIFDLEKWIDGIIEELWLKISFDGVYTIWDFEEIEIAISKLKNQKEESDLAIIRAENEVLKQDKANLLAELTRQINEKSALRKENKRLKKRRREWRYNPKKVYEKLARWWLCYIPEWDYLPTKVHESLIDAMEEWHRLADKTWNQVYIVWTYCKI